METKKLYAILDKDGDVCETFDKDTALDEIFRKIQIYYPGSKVYEGTLTIGNEVLEECHKSAENYKPASSVKV